MKGPLYLCLLTVTYGLAVKCPNTPSCSSDCQLPTCSCSGAEPNIPLADRPQIVYLTFDDAFTNYAMNNFYKDLFEGPKALKNPNGDPIRATHFLSHKYTSYSDVHKYYYDLGHEMASHSITHLSNTTYWKYLNEEGWKNEIYGMKEMMKVYGGIEPDDIKGFRVPFLQGGAETMLNALQSHFTYDCSMPSQAFGYLNLENGLWPYTLDYKSIQDCEIEPCPSCSYPGFWIQPMLDLEDERFGLNPSHPEAGMPCSMLDACVVPEVYNAQVVEDMLLRSFNRSYFGDTRAPFGIYMHAAWFFGQDWHYEGYQQFLKTITSELYEDVWIVPISAGIEYMKNPVPKADLSTYAPFLRQPKVSASKCTMSINCKYTNVKYPNFEISEIYMNICGQHCPPKYPWLNNVLGN